MAKFEEAEKRLFRNKFVCRKCKSVVKAPNIKILEGKIACRKCGGKAFKPVRRK